MSETALISREIRLAAIPDGLPEPADLAVTEAPVPVPGPGEVLVRNRFFTVFAGLRTLLGGGVPGAPLPGLRIGDTLFGPVACLAQGVTPYGALARAARVRPGDTVFISGGAGSVGSMTGQIARLLGAGIYGPAEVGRLRVIRELLSLGLTVADLRGCADRLDLLEGDTLPPYGAPGGCASPTGIAARRIAALDGEIARLTALRDKLAARVAAEPARQ